MGNINKHIVNNKNQLMKKSFYLIIGILFSQFLFGQAYVNFPTDTAKWNNLNWHQTNPSNSILLNYDYVLQGDTLINNKTYKKVYCTLTEYLEPPIYIGGLREDSVKNIYFFPYNTHLPPLDITEFPNNTEEHLLYTFDSLYVGMILPINIGNTTIQVYDIDSILIGSNYRKRYKIDNNNLLGWNYWIEGIGSDKELFSPYCYEFEWYFYTLCFTDTATYYINSPNGADSCHYSLTIDINEKTFDSFSIHPNPVENMVIINGISDSENTKVSIYNIQGQKVQTLSFEKKEFKIDVSTLKKGIYILKILTDNKIKTTKFIKK